MRKLTMNEIDFVAGGPVTAGGLVGSAVAGGIVGGVLGASAGGVGAVPGALVGAITGVAAYFIFEAVKDLIDDQ